MSNGPKLLNKLCYALTTSDYPWAHEVAEEAADWAMDPECELHDEAITLNWVQVAILTNALAQYCDMRIKKREVAAEIRRQAERVRERPSNAGVAN